MTLIQKGSLVEQSQADPVTRVCQLRGTGATGWSGE